MLSNPLIASVGAAAACVKFEMWRLKENLGGPRHPDSPACWIELMTYSGQRCRTERLDGDAFTVHHPAFGWVAVFDRTAPLALQCRQLAHEFAEYLLATMESPDEPCPPMPDTMTVEEWRHLVSEEVVRLFWPS